MNPAGRRTYPIECLEIFKTVRRCFGQKWSADQVEEVLAARYPAVSGFWGDLRESGPEIAAQAADHPSLLKEMTASMIRIAAALDQQSTLLGKLEQFRHELNTLRDEKLQADAQVRDQIGRLENELERLKNLDQRKKDSFRQAPPEHPRQDINSPGPDFLSNPLTVHYPPQRYLGIKDNRNAALNLKQLMEAMQGNASGTKGVTFSWQADGDAWTLTAGLFNPDVGQDRKIILQAKLTVTPQGNAVTEITRMMIDGRELSKDDQLKFFKLYRAGMARD